jgi:hypothetical protein
MRSFATIFVLLALVSVATPTTAQAENPLFDTFNFKLEASRVRTNTTIRLDSENLGQGTTIRLENDLALGEKKFEPSLSFEWQMGRRHRLGVRWQEIDRESTAQVLREIEWGGVVIPVEANVTLGFDINTLAIDYTYYPWVKERWAGGFGLGFRVLDLKTTLTVEDTELEEQVDGTAALPYVNFEYRRVFGKRWRVKAALGWLEVKIGDVKGGQYIGRLAGEFIPLRHWGFGIAGNLSTVDVDWQGIESPNEDDELRAKIALDINDISLYVRFRF